MAAIHSRGTLPISLVVALALVPPVFAQSTSQSIFKCVEGETTSYQSIPCGGGKTEVRVLTVASAAEAESRTPAAAIPRIATSIPTAQSRGKMWPPRRTLMLGMSDDEVLNLAGWGVPQHITRTKGSRAWREEWTYAGGERRLYFVNATLVDAALDDNASEAMARVASTRRAYPAT